MGPWCLTNSDYIGGGVRPISNSVWVVVLHLLRRGEERILSANRLINVAIRKLRAWQNRSKAAIFVFVYTCDFTGYVSGFESFRSDTISAPDISI